LATLYIAFKPMLKALDLLKQRPATALIAALTGLVVGLTAALVLNAVFDTPLFDIEEGWPGWSIFLIISFSLAFLGLWLGTHRSITLGSISYIFGIFLGVVAVVYSGIVGFVTAMVYLSCETGKCLEILWALMYIIIFIIVGIASIIAGRRALSRPEASAKIFLGNAVISLLSVLPMLAAVWPEEEKVVMILLIPSIGLCLIFLATGTLLWFGRRGLVN